MRTGQPCFFISPPGPECRAELQTLDTLATEYDNIDFYVVSYNEDVAIVDDYINERTYTDLIPVQPASPMVADFEITRQMAMVAVNANGIIYHRQVMGRAEEWVPYFQEMQATPRSSPPAWKPNCRKSNDEKTSNCPVDEGRHRRRWRCPLNQ